MKKEIEGYDIKCIIPDFQPSALNSLDMRTYSKVQDEIFNDIFFSLRKITNKKK